MTVDCPDTGVVTVGGARLPALGFGAYGLDAPDLGWVLPQALAAESSG